MYIYPPEGSNIVVKAQSITPEIIIPHRKTDPSRLFVGLFLLCWMGGWFMGFVSALKELLEGMEPFLLFWLAGWTVGGFFAAYMIFRIFRPSVPEKYIFDSGSLKYDSGIPPFKMYFNYAQQNNAWKNIYYKRKVIEFNSSELKTICLRETDAGNRLTIDKGTSRIDLAPSASEIEREWLYKTIKENFS